jgi:hypothetical protein
VSSYGEKEQDRCDGSRGMATSNASKWGANAMDVLDKMRLLLQETGPVSKSTICSQFKRRYGFDPTVAFNVEGKSKTSKIAHILESARICFVEERMAANGTNKKKFLVPITTGKASSESAVQLPIEVSAGSLLYNKKKVAIVNFVFVFSVQIIYSTRSSHTRML